MSAKNRSNSPKRPTLEEEVANIERLSPAEIDAELAKYHIDPEPAINTVKTMVQEKLTDWRRRGVLHAEKEIAHAGGGED